jgi:hypothetical protein
MPAMKRDQRYKYVKFLLDKGEIKSFNEIFDTLPKTVLAKDMGFKMVRLNKLLSRPARFTLRDIFIMASFFEIDKFVMLRVVFEQYLLNKREK